MRMNKNYPSTLARKIKMWQEKYVAGEITWDEAEWIIKALAAQYQTNQNLQHMMKEVKNA